MPWPNSIPGFDDCWIYHIAVTIWRRLTVLQLWPRHVNPFLLLLIINFLGLGVLYMHYDVSWHHSIMCRSALMSRYFSQKSFFVSIINYLWFNVLSRNRLSSRFINKAPTIIQASIQTQHHASWGNSKQTKMPKEKKKQKQNGDIDGSTKLQWPATAVPAEGVPPCS